MILKLVIIAVVSYLLGNISSGILVSRAFGGGDIRKHGSGNSGTTNVLRTLGWLPSLLTLLGDCVKGLIACLLGRWLGGDLGMLLAGLCVTLGHDFPVFFGFKGGKGIATSLGMILVISPVLALSLLSVVLIVVALTGLMSLGSVMVSVAYPILTAIIFRGHANYPLFVIFSIICGLLSLYCHRKNIVRLIHKEENRLDFKRISRISEKLRGRKK